MAKVRQLTGTFQNQTQSVFRPTVDATGLATGVASAANAYQQAKVARQQHDLQLYQAQGENSNWMLTDWRNNFLLNMNSPAKLQEYFTGTPFESVVAGMDESTQLYDSTYAQTLYSQAVQTAAQGIGDEAYRNQWMTARMNEWEQYEVQYQQQANGVMQTEARRTETQNLNSIFKENGTESLEFRTKLDEMYAKGLIDLEQADGLLLNYQKAEQRAVIEARLWNNLMPLDEDGNVVPDLIKTEEQMKIVAHGLDLSMDGVAYMNNDEVQEVIDLMINKANNYTTLHEQYIEEGRAAMYDNYWGEIQGILFSDSISAAQKTGLLQSMADELVTLYGKDMPQYQTGQADIPIVSRGAHDSDELNKLMNKLNSVVSSGGVEASTNDGLTQAINIAYDPRISPQNKVNAITRLGRDGLISMQDQEQYSNEAMSRVGSMYGRIHTRALNIAETEGWTQPQIAELNSQLQGLYDTSGGLSPLQVESNAEAIISSFYDKNNTLPGIIDDWQDGGNPWNQPVNSRGDIRIMTEGKQVQDMIEKGYATGYVRTDPQFFSEYATQSGLAFQRHYVRGNLDYVGPAMKMVANAEGTMEPEVIATLVDPTGNALIAVPLEDQSNRELGTIEVALFQPMVARTRSGRAQREIEYVRVTDQPNYYFTSYDDTDNMIDPYRDGVSSYVIGTKRMIVAGTGRALDLPAGRASILSGVSLDPSYYSSRSLLEE